MHRRSRIITGTFMASLLALSLVVFCSSSRSLAQDKKGDDHAGMSGHKMDDNKMAGAHQPTKEEMDAMMKAGMPGPEHQEMMKSAGDWDAEVRMNMGGQWSAPMKGTMHMEPVFDGRYMMMKYEGVMNMGGGDMPFKGMGLMGYDNTKKVYFSTWIDSMSTAMMKTEGTKEGNTVTLKGHMMDPMTNKDCEVKEIATHTDADHMSYEMYGPGPDGKEMKMMEIKYTRKK